MGAKLGRGNRGNHGHGESPGGEPPGRCVQHQGVRQRGTRTSSSPDTGGLRPLVPTLSYFSQTPGAAKIVFRGVSDAPIAFIAQSSASLYLDDQPLTQNFNVDVRMVDIERLEALSGPQGTLYGDSSQSGLLRIITNKPDPSGFRRTPVLWREGALTAPRATTSPAPSTSPLPTSAPPFDWWDSRLGTEASSTMSWGNAALRPVGQLRSR